ncbi:DUF3558 domain-containing protein [Streptomyces luteolus]|uniref:DUF3558 domain-containing protein n=1 Tax=Streptomyces luteolus TaxID=3043615 RepID=A0ABT6T7M2_9ACTN|nr:DUF3558 domain-containing protein [Streptomyces sp. B-S-A12]MDI3423898.1 DUF3558 domain-containing protein [Streptomyces sp. B-S-A12]
MHRKGPRFTRILAACAAAPVILTAAACSSDSDAGKGDGGGSDSGGNSSSAASGKEKPAAVEKAAFSKLPEACKTLKGDTIEDLVPEVDEKSGKSANSEDTSVRASCSWTGLDSKGTKGSQFRWLNLGLVRYDSNATLGSGDKLAQAQLTKKVEEAKALDDAKNVETKVLEGVGDEATLVTSDQKKKEGDFKNHRVVARVENAVVVIDYNGAGLAGAGDPDSKKMAKDAQEAAEEAVASVKSANEPSDKSGSKTGDSSSDKTDGSDKTDNAAASTGGSADKGSDSGSGSGSGSDSDSDGDGDSDGDSDSGTSTKKPSKH